MAFTSSFFSWAGQKERLSNAFNTIVSAVSGGGVTTASKKDTFLNRTVSAAASHPFTTAAVVATAAAPKAALSLVKAGGQALAKSSAKTKITTALVAPAAVTILAKNPGLPESAGKQWIRSSSNIANNVDNFAKNPSMSSAATIVKENPIATTTAGLGLAAALGWAGSSLISTGLNTMAVRKNTSTTTDIAKYLSSNPTVATTNQTLGSATSKYDVEIAELNAKTQLKMAELQLKNTEAQQKINTSLAANPIAESPIPNATVQKKKTTKKKKKSKKKKAKKRTKKRTVKKRNIRSKKGTKSKTIKRRKKKR